MLLLCDLLMTIPCMGCGWWHHDVLAVLLEDDTRWGATRATPPQAYSNLLRQRTTDSIWRWRCDK